MSFDISKYIQTHGMYLIIFEKGLSWAVVEKCAPLQIITLTYSAVHCIVESSEEKL